MTVLHTLFTFVFVFANLYLAFWIIWKLFKLLK